MNDHGVVTGPDTIVFKRELPGPLERVWAYLTESDKRAKWFAGGEMELREGGKVHLFFHHANLNPRNEPVPESHKAAHDPGVHAYGTVTRCEPPHVLSFTWGDDSVVTFELTPRGDKVLLVLTHAKLADRAATVDVAGGWHIHLAMLEDNLHDRELRPFWSTLKKLEEYYQKEIPQLGKEVGNG